MGYEGNELYLKRLYQAMDIANYRESTIAEIMGKYETLAKIENGIVDKSAISADLEGYSGILLPIIYRSIYMNARIGLIKELLNNLPELSKIMDKSLESREQFFQKYAKYVMENGIEIDGFGDTSEETVRTKCSLIGVEVVPDVVAEDLVTESEIVEESDDFDWEDVEEDFGSGVEDTEEEWEESEDEDGIWGEEEESKEEPVEVEKKSGSNYEELREVWGDKLESVVSGIMQAYDKLYESCYGVAIPSGILTNRGIIRSTTEGKVIISGNPAMDIELFKAIQSVITKNFNQYAEDGREPNIADIDNSKYPIIYTSVHIKCMFGHLNYCTGREDGIRAYLTKNNINNKSTTKVTKYSDIKGWIKETLENYFYKAYLDWGITSEVNEDSLNKTNRINEEMSRCLKNVIAVVERNKGVNTRIRICTDDPVDINKLTRSIEESLNVGSSSGIIVKQIGQYSDGVVDLNIIYNEKRHSKESLFAYQVLDTLKEQDIVPSWDNVVLGKREDGTIMVYNFKDRQNPTYALYAASGSGKGVMSLNLVASAMADGCKVLYVDGKPDMGCVLADIAWKDGLDTAVYNGVDGKGSEMLENRGNCIRTEQPLGSIDKIPDGIFLTIAEKRRYMLITTYIKGIQMICETAAFRSSQKLGGEDWVVAFVDECEQASVSEIEVMKCLERAETERKGAKDENGKKIDLTKDEAYKFIQNYRRWVSVVVSNFKTCVTSTFRYANMTTFFVWQSTKFPEKYKNASSIASVIDSASGNIVKIMGRGAAVTYGSSAFGTPSSLKEATWYDDRFSGKNGGFFAIGKNVQSNSMKVFRPFNVFSDANNRELIVENAKATGLKEEDLIGVSLDRRGNVIPEVGFEGYANKLLERFGKNTAQQLNVGFKYFDGVVRELGLGEGINQFMYETVEVVKVDNQASGCDGSGTGNSPTFSSEENEIFGNEPEGSGAKVGNGISDSPTFEEDDMFGEEERRVLKDAGASEEKEVRARVSSDRFSKISDFNQAYDEFKGYSNGDDLPEEMSVDVVQGNIGISTDASGNVHVKDKSGLSVINLDARNYVETPYVNQEKMRKGLLRMKDSEYGINSQFKNRWNLVLNTISSAFPNDSMVIRVSIAENGIVVNDRVVNIRSLLDDGFGVYLEDIANFRAMFKRFRMIKELEVDSSSFNWLVREYGVNVNNVFRVFSENPNLMVVRIVTYDGNRPMVIDRNNFGSKQVDIQKRANEAELRQQVEQMCASYNPELEKKGVGYKNRVSTASFGFTKNNWSRAKNNLADKNNKHRGRAVLWVGIAGVTGIVGSIAWSGGKLFNMFKS